MKRFSVGKRLGIGFGIQVLLIIIMSAAAIVGACNQSVRLASVGAAVEMQQDIYEGLKVYNEARLQAREVMLGNGNVYNSYLAQVEKAYPILDSMQEDAAAIEKFPTEALDNLGEGLTQWHRYVKGVYQYYLLQEEQIAEIERISNELTEQAGLLYRQLLYSESVSKEQMELAGELIGQIGVLKEEGVKEFSALMARDNAQLTEELEEALGIIAQLRKSGASSAHLDNLEETLLSYQGAINTFAEMREENISLYKTNAYKLGNDIYQQAVVLSEEMELHIASAIRSSARIYQVFLGAFASVAILAIGLACFTAKRITKNLTGPMVRMSTAFSSVAEDGNLSAVSDAGEQFSQDAERNDELGQTICAFQNMLARLEKMGNYLREIADKNLNLQVKPLSSKDIVGKSLQEMADSLNEMMHHILVSSTGMAASAQELAANSEGLAQSNSEQAAAAEELNAAMMQANDECQKGARSVAAIEEKNHTMQMIAENSAREVEDMERAMQDIQHAAKTVQGIIETIGDIAMQTKMLALNAAIEAAHAGGDGKGFAVVAEQVKHLAATSELAAKDTNRLIYDSLLAIEQGIEISGRTCHSFTEILGGIRGTGGDLEEVVHMIQAQARVMEQMNASVSQITQGIVLNTQSAEECAAASEQVNAQANTLQALAEQFRLREEK